MTNAELAILSLIAEQPLHGYEIEQIIEQRGMRNWTEIAFSSIYYVLKKLEQSGLVEGRLAEQKGQGPARRVYHITPAGEAAWREASLEALTSPEPRHTSFLLGLANLPGIPHAERLAGLRAYAEGLKAQCDQMLAAIEAQQPLPFSAKALFDYSLHMARAELEWVEAFIVQVEQHGDQPD